MSDSRRQRNHKDKDIAELRQVFDKFRHSYSSNCTLR
jgi:hypothetical protein